MNNDTRRTTGITRSTTALGAAVLVMGSLALGACSKSDPNASSPAPAAQSQQQGAGAASSGSDTIDLVDAAVQTSTGTPAATDGTSDAKAGRKGLRARLLRALHATWVTEGKSGPVTHQAVRGEVTAVSATSVTVKARDGFSLTYAVTGDTKVRTRSNGKGSDSAIGSVKVGDKALVLGVGATNPTARVVVFKDAASSPARTPSPSATS